MNIVIGRGNSRKVIQLSASRTKIEHEMIVEDLKAFIFRPKTLNLRKSVQS